MYLFGSTCEEASNSTGTEILSALVKGLTHSKEKNKYPGLIPGFLCKEQHFFLQITSESLVKQWKGGGFMEQGEMHI